MPGILKLLSVLVIGYIISAIGLVGIPGVSRLGLVFTLLMLIVVTIGSIRKEIRIKRWVMQPILLYIYLIFLSLVTWYQIEDKPPFLTLGPVTTAWLGAILVAVGIDNGIRWNVVVRTLLLAGILQIIAIYFGFDASALIMERSGTLSASSLRLTALAGNANLLAMTLVLPLFLVYLRPEVISWPWKIASLLLPYYAIVVTGSRKGVMLSALLLILVLLQKLLSSKRNRVFYIIAIILITFIAVANFVEIDLYETTRELGIQSLNRWVNVLQGGDRGFETRSYIASLWQEPFFSSPLIGHGLDMFEEISGAGMYAHNNFVEILVNGGVIFFILYYSLLIVILVKSAYFPTVEKVYLWGTIMSIAIIEVAMVTYTVKLNVLVLILLFSYVSNRYSVTPTKKSIKSS